MLRKMPALLLLLQRQPTLPASTHVTAKVAVMHNTALQCATKLTKNNNNNNNCDSR